jgi:enoyl-CoA hydratase
MPVLYAQHGHVAVISLNRPKYGNAQNADLLYALDQAFRRAATDPQVKSIVLRGEGKHFSSGHDIGTPDCDFETSWPDRRSMWYDHVGLPGAEANYGRRARRLHCRRPDAGLDRRHHRGR